MLIARGTESVSTGTHYPKRYDGDAPTCRDRVGKKTETLWRFFFHTPLAPIKDLRIGATNRSFRNAWIHAVN